MKNKIILCLFALSVQSCGDIFRDTPPVATPSFKIGTPYTVNNVTYVPKLEPHYSEVGMASWYGPGFNNRKTSNGEIFNKNLLTGAHRTLPMPSIVKVTNLENGKSIDLRINDRGPFSRKRILDVSEAAAVALGFKLQGHAKVKVDFKLDESYEAAKGVPIKEADRHMLTQAYGFSQSHTIQHMPQISTAAVTSEEIPTPAIPQAVAPLEQKLETSNNIMPSQASNQLIAVSNVGSNVMNNSVQNNIAANNNQVANLVSTNNTSGNFYVQIAAVSSKVDADITKNKIHNYDTLVEETLVSGRSVYRVQAGAFSDRASAENAKNNLTNLGYTGAYVVEK